MITLYEHPLSPYAQKVKIALREKGMAFETADARRSGRRRRGRARSPRPIRGPRCRPWWTAIVSVFDSTIILEYLEDSLSDPALLPASPADRARVRMLEEVMDTHFEAINWGLSELRWFKRARGRAGRGARGGGQGADRGLLRLAGAAARRSRTGSTARPSAGATWRWFPSSTARSARAIARRKARGWPTGWPAPTPGRPSSTTVAEIAAMAQASAMANVAELVEKGLFKREYRDHRLEWMIKSGGLDVVLKGLERDNIRFAPAFR